MIAAWTSRKTLWALLISVALNLLVLAWIGAHFVRGEFRPPREGGPGIERLAATLPKPDGDVLRASYAADRADIEAARAAFRQAQTAMRATLRAEPFDASAFQQATTNVQGRRRALEDTLNRSLGKALPQMSPEGRARMAQRGPG